MAASTHTLFLHVVAATAVVASLALEIAALVYMPRASTIDEAGRWLRVGVAVAITGGTALLVVLATGAGLVEMESWSWRTPWVDNALTSVVLLALVGGALTGPRRAAMKRLLTAPSAAVDDALRRAASHPLLWTSLSARVGIVLAILWQMTVRPERTPGLVATAAFVAIGALASLPAWLRARSRA